MAKALTAISVARLRPNGKQQEVPDGGSGLYLQIGPTGTKSWALRFRRPDGRSAKLVLGRVAEVPVDDVEPALGSPLSLAGARRLAARLRHELASGRDPAKERKAARTRRAEAETFVDSAKDFVEIHASKTRRAKQTASLLGLSDGEVIEGSLCDRWRAKPTSEIDADELFRVIDEAREKGVPGVAVRKKGPRESRARALHAALSVMFGWLVERRRLKANPMALLSAPAAPRARERTLSDEEVCRFWRAAGEVSTPFSAVLRLLLLTGQRLNEVAGMRREEVDLENGVWRIPGERTKNHRAHAITLAPIARAIVERAAERATGDLLFTTTQTSPISGWSKVKGRLDARMGEGIPPWRLHDLRRTCVTGMARAGADLAVIERCVNHVSGSFGGIVAVYQKHKYEDEIAKALCAWEELLMTILEGEAR